VCDDFGVGFCGEAMAFLGEFLLKRNVVLDDAIVNDNNFPAAVAMRVGVLFGGAAMSGPTGVSDTVCSVEGFQPDYFFEIAQLAFGSPNLKTFTVAANCDSGRVIPTVFKSPQTIKNDGNHPLFANITHDSAHANDS
jgi:hypothetical protein